MSFLPSLILFLGNSKYFLIFVGSFVEGSVVMMTTGLLWRLGAVQFWPAYAALMAGDVLSDSAWYALGRYAARPFSLQWGHLIGASPEVIRKMQGRFNTYHLRILVISKLTMGFGLATVILTVAGMMRVSYVRYVTINFLCGIVWILFLMGVGYYFGNLLNYVPADLRVAVGVTIPILFFVGVRGLSLKLVDVGW